jgi:hypothetical protein
MAISVAHNHHVWTVPFLRLGQGFCYTQAQQDSQTGAAAERTGERYRCLTDFLLPPCDFINVLLTFLIRRDSTVGIATGYGLDDRGLGVRVPVGSRIFSSPRRPDRLWGPPSHLSNE